MASQQALEIIEIGKPLVKTTRPIPTPGEGEIVVKVTSAGLNPHDQKLRDHGLWGTKPPIILADDVAGEIISLGPGVTNLKKGDHVFGQSNVMAHTDTAGLQQYALLTAALIAEVPSTLTGDQAATIPVNSLAPFVGLFHESGLGFPPPGSTKAAAFGYEDKTLVIIGGGGNCGKFGVQFASMVKLGCIVVIASPSSAVELKSYGATHVIDRYLSNEEIKRQVLQATGGDNVTYIYDALNYDLTLAVSLLSSTEKGVVANLVPTRNIDEKIIVEKKGGYEVKKVFGASHAWPEFLAESFWKKMPGWIEKGLIRPLGFKVVKQGLNVDGVNKVLDDYRDQKNPGKWHVHPNEQ